MGLTKLPTLYYADDGEKRGPMTTFRVRFHPTEPKLLVQIVDRRLALFDLAAEPTKEIKGKGKGVLGELVTPHEIGWVRALDISPDGKQVIAGGSDRRLLLWPWIDGKPAEKPTQQVAAHAGWVEAVSYSPDGKFIVSVGADRLVKVWNAADLTPVKTLTGHTKFIADVVFTADGQRCLTGGEDGLVIAWNTADWSQQRSIDFGQANDQFGQTPRHSGVHRLSISHDQKWLAVIGGEKLDIVNLETGEAAATEKASMDVCFHPQLPLLAVGEQEVKLWEYDADQFQPGGKDKNGKLQPPKVIAGKVAGNVKRGDWSLGMRFSPTGKQLALGKSDGTVELYEVTS